MYASLFEKCQKLFFSLKVTYPRTTVKPAGLREELRGAAIFARWLRPSCEALVAPSWFQPPALLLLPSPGLLMHLAAEGKMSKEVHVALPLHPCHRLQNVVCLAECSRLWVWRTGCGKGNMAGGYKGGPSNLAGPLLVSLKDFLVRQLQWLEVELPSLPHSREGRGETADDSCKQAKPYVFVSIYPIQEHVIPGAIFSSA